ncbi:MAG: autotransporter outer membrane beta-barrel domain-containing protein [Nitrospirae bacterium]|nr:autotransporter outer membrane beta-barrel domain-containing protein [Nitrospirota bacterium]
MQRYIILLLSALFLIMDHTVYASEIDMELTFKRIAIFSLEDNTKEGYGSLISRSIRNNFIDTIQFEIVIPDETIKYPISKKETIKIGRKLNVDAVVTGNIKVEEGILKIFTQIINAKTGDLFATENKWIKETPTEENIKKNVKELAAKLIGRMPYKAVVTEIIDNEIIINVGRFHGIEEATRLIVFEIKRVERHPFTNEIINIEKEEIGKLTAVKVEDTITRAKVKEIKKGKIVEVNNKIDFKPSLKAIADSTQRKKEFLTKKEKAVAEEKVKKEAKPEKRSYNIVGIDAIVGYATNDYSFNSNELKFTRKASSFLTAGFKGELWPVSFLGLDISYKTGWLKFDKIGTTSIDTKASPYWLSTNLKYRYIFTDKPTSPHLIGRVGYHIYDFSVSNSDLLYFNNYSYKGINIGLGAKIPFWDSFGININGDYLPSLSVKEDPVTSGSKGKASGYLLGMGLYYILTDGFILDLNYSYNSYKADFTGTGTRGSGTTNASSTDTYNGINMNIRYEF